MNLPTLWILAGFAAGIAIAERCPGSLRLWAVAAALGILAGGILAAGFLHGGTRFWSRGFARSWRGSRLAEWL